MEKTVNKETAQLAQKKGFDKMCLDFITEHGEEENLMMYIGDTFEEKLDTAKDLILYFRPSQSVLQKWLRDIHSIRVLIDFETIDDSETAYTWNIVEDLSEGKGRKKDTWDFYNRLYSFSMERMAWYDTYEDALEAGLQEALKLISAKK